jgi:esterase/lipase superfamily enzyme
MLVGTTRKPADPAEMFSGDRGPTPSFANITVSVPPASARQIGEVQWPRQVPGDPATEFVTLKADVIDRNQALAWFHRTLRTVPKRQVLVFIHGFNNRFDDAVFRFAQIVHDSHAPVVPILFTWPSRGSVLAYGYDRESTAYSRNALESLLKAISRNPTVGEISILAHSMGNSLALETLRQMAIRDGRVTPKSATSFSPRLMSMSTWPGKRLSTWARGRTDPPSPCSCRRMTGRWPSPDASGAARLALGPSIPTRSRTGHSLKMRT